MPDGLTICVVDDDASMRSATESLLRSFGYCVRVFCSAEELLGSCAASNSACIISDVQMPGKSGYDLARELTDGKVATPIVLMTAFYDRAAVAKAKSAGAACILPKPFGADELIACIEKAIAA